MVFETQQSAMKSAIETAANISSQIANDSNKEGIRKIIEEIASPHFPPLFFDKLTDDEWDGIKSVWMMGCSHGVKLCMNAVKQALIRQAKEGANEKTTEPDTA